MASNVFVRNLDDVRAFSAYLRALSGNLSIEFDNARREMYSVSEGWNDQENIAFMQEFEQTVETINRISQRMDEYGIFLSRKCDILQEYMSTRL